MTSPTGRPLVVAALAAALVAGPALAGCLDATGGAGGAAADDPPSEVQEDPADGLAEASVRTLSGDCGSCFEPTVAAGPDGTVYAATVPGDRIHSFVPATNGSLEPVDEPPLPEAAPATAERGDDTVHVDPDGRLWFTSLVSNPGALVKASGFLGIQVAVSDDGGASWTRNRLLSPPTDPGSPTAAADRQWVTFEPDGTAHMIFSSYGTRSGIWHGTSSDGGQTWSDWDRAVAREERGSHDVAGPPTVADGRVLVPYDARDGSRDLEASDVVRLAAKPVEGGDWVRHDVAVGDEVVTGDPRVAVADDGRLVTAWIRAGRQVHVATADAPSGDWSRPERWNPMNGPRLDPDAAAHDGVLDVTWLRNAGNRTEVVLVRGPVAAEEPDQRVVLDAFDHDRDTTDFADLAVTPDGTTAVVWSTGSALRIGAAPSPTSP